MIAPMTMDVNELADSLLYEGQIIIDGAGRKRANEICDQISEILNRPVILREVPPDWHFELELLNTE